MRNEKTKIMVEGAAMVALATVLSFIRVFKLPWGGSITLLSMLPVTLYSIRRGVKTGMIAAFVYSIVQLVQGIMDGLFGWGLTPAMLVACILIDYILAFSVLGLAGLFRNKKLVGWISGITLSVVLRFLLHFTSGVIIWHSYGELWEGFSTDSSALYSFLYNGCYMLPELAFTLIGAVIFLKAPQTSKFLLKDIEA